ncbi:MAG: hypothetical protein AB7E37_06625 [Candidatus Altimarinota bacterium]|jgi:hypothetical protein|uniref:Uncharacterized protein n=1 Tax=Arcobacter defluvii TaxID=873191 RepID=A0AAE7BIM2_9BACT|nr:hypothetical protein [Arcobacter defluvii]MDY0051759.1 hypothetical protein [Aliarcobacter sp.]QKF78732.1 hypothetical protein ADFLV_2760 [Arcobacter defluvii]RXI33957.1 hypothetical protein CP964_03735 [Arcobacter defluvii]
MIVSILLEIYTMLKNGKNREEVQKILLAKAKELLKKDKEDFEDYQDRKKSQNIENEKIILEIEKQLNKQKQQENQDFKEFY